MMTDRYNCNIFMKSKIREKQKQKLIITLWRGQIDNPQNFQIIYCRLTYNGQEYQSKPIQASKSLTWKQTFVFPLSFKSEHLRLDFINTQKNQQIHFAKDQVLQTLSLGKATALIDLDNSNRGTVPAKLPIIHIDENVGTIFLEYEIMKTEVTYIVQKLLDYEFMIKMSGFRITFTRQLSTIPNFYLKFLYGSRSHKQDFAFEEMNGAYIYNYPVKLYLKEQNIIDIQVQLKGNYSKDYRNPNTSFETQSNYSNGRSIRKIGNKKNQLDLSIVDKLISIFDLNYKKNTSGRRKLPLNLMIKNTEREVGSFEFDFQVVFKTRQEKEEYQVQKKRQEELKNKKPSVEKKKKERYQIPKNGSIIINSIIGKLDIPNEGFIQNKDISIQSKLGRNTQLSSILENPGKQLIFMDTFTFKRTWEQNIKFTVFLHLDDKKLPIYFTDVNIRDLFEVGRYMAKKLELKDQKNRYSGTLTIDMIYVEEQQKPKQSPKKKVVKHEKSAEQFEMEKKQLKKMQILQRMRKREEEKKKREGSLQSRYPTFSDKELYLPPIRTQRDDKKTLSPKRSINQSVNVYNRGGLQCFTKSPRFEDQRRASPDSFLYHPNSDFESKEKRGMGIGYGNKFDFTKPKEVIPGVGKYHIPSVWDKYK